MGDPLCAPFPRKALQPSDIDKGLDPATELPALFSAASAAGAGRDRHASRGGARWRCVARPAPARATRQARRRRSRTRRRSTRASTARTCCWRATYEEQKAYDKAIERYRLVLASKPGNLIALNNLAYVLAVHKNQPAEALGYAERAYTLLARSRSSRTRSPGCSTSSAATRRRPACSPTPRASSRTTREVRLHAAVVFAAVGMMDAAAKELAEALRLDPSLRGHEDVKALTGKLKKQ